LNRSGDSPFGRVLHDLQERAKELACLYRVDEILSRPGLSTEEAVRAILAALPAGWQYPDACVARAVLGRRVFEPEDFRPTPWRQSAELEVHGQSLGRLEIYYTRELPGADEGPFLGEERKLLAAIADRVAAYVTRRGAVREPSARPAPPSAGWWVIVEFLRQTDRVLFGRLGRKMINHLCASGLAEAERLLRQAAPSGSIADGLEDNRPLPRAGGVADAETAEAAFRLAPEHLPDEEILTLVEGWIREEKTTFLKHAVERSDTPLPELIEALDRFRHGGVGETDLSLASQLGLRASLVRRFLTDQLAVVNTAKQVLRVTDFEDLTHRIVAPAKSHGRIGGKSAGLFLAAKIVQRAAGFADLLGEIRIPRSWYVPSDGILDFIAHNDLSDVHNRKYLEPDRIRLEYPHLVQLFKSSYFSPEMLRGLAVVLDDLEGRPIIVRSSSLLEDRLGSAFSGKYKSLFLANTGDKEERLAALTDAIAEVYASVFSPDPIEYRARRGFLDMHEEMGILIQEVVGRRVGSYFLPAFSGVGFSNNEFRWSPRIRREDGLLRMVPGLGTRAVDRLSDDYPVLIAPGQPGLRVNQTASEAVRYSPKKMDVINLETASFETVDLHEFLATQGEAMPLIRQLVSVVDQDRIRPGTSLLDLGHDEVIVNFEGLISGTPFVARMAALLRVLRERLETPVDVEFACDGESVYLLQCRPQGATHGDSPAAIPSDLPRERVLFTANRYVSNGRVGDVTHVVYVDPEAYGALDPDRMREVSRVVGRLNRLLPKRQFVLMGPGRWGSRGDIRLGVPVGYSDISNAAVLIEIARQRGGYVPDLSFGTHFFQDLVESSIRYLPLYPDDPRVTFAEDFFVRSSNTLADLLPEFAGLAGVVHVIDVPRVSDGLVLKVLMNGDLDQAVGVLGGPEEAAAPAASAFPARPAMAEPESPENHWRWRQRMAERIAEEIDAERFGVRAIYLLGSAKNATAGPSSDIDLLLVADSDPQRRRELELWLDGWSRALAETNFLRTGERLEALLDCHFVTGEDVRAGRGPAAKIGAVTDAARALPLSRRN
jgi:pyruvate,water dikinase